MATPGDAEKPEILKDNIMSNRLEDILQCSNILRQRVVVTSATYPYHVEWTNSEWSKACGWQSDEILGLDCKFLQGDVTDQMKVSNFMTKLFSTGGYSDLKVLNYHRDNTLLQNTIRCFPVIDNCGPDFSSQVSHIAAILVQTKEFTLSEEDMGLMENWHLKEVGMPIDRREGCHVYPHCNSLPPPSALEWQVLSENLPLALMLRYMLRSQAPIVLTDSEERIVHVNLSWVTLTGHIAIECEGKTLSSLFHDSTEEKSLLLYNNLVDKCMKKNVVMYGDDKDYSAYSTDSESSDETQLVSTPRTASIVIKPAPRTSGNTRGFQTNPWGVGSTHSKPKINLLVTPAAIKSKHMAFLFSDATHKRNENIDKRDSCESSSPRKRSKSVMTQGLTSAYSPFGCSSSSSIKNQDGSGVDPQSNTPFDSSHLSFAPGSFATSQDTARKRLLRCATMPAHRSPTNSPREHSTHLHTRVGHTSSFQRDVSGMSSYSPAVGSIRSTETTPDSDLNNNLES